MADRQRAYRRGHVAEHLAAWALRLKGYRIIARRFRTPVGEVDLIARRRDLVLFVEVKARVSEMAARDAVGAKARQRISRAANWWISQQGDAGTLNWRFDIIAVLPRRWPIHIEDAWQSRT